NRAKKRDLRTPATRTAANGFAMRNRTRLALPSASRPGGADRRGAALDVERTGRRQLAVLPAKHVETAVDHALDQHSRAVPRKGDPARPAANRHLQPRPQVR